MKAIDKKRNEQQVLKKVIITPYRSCTLYTTPRNVMKTYQMRKMKVIAVMKIFQINRIQMSLTPQVSMLPVMMRAM